MTDRELLELAAKAAGIEIGWPWTTTVDVPSNPYLVKNLNRWNPLTNDGDALRLAVDLRLFILPTLHGEMVLVDSFTEIGAANEPNGSDPYAATRRAIVRAAAEIGKAAA